MDGRIAQSVERWSNKPLVMGSSPIVTIVFFLICQGSTHERIRGRAVKALRSGRSQLCWRGFESHRMQFFFFSIAWPGDSVSELKKNGGTGIRARVKRITTAYANHYTIPPHPCSAILPSILDPVGPSLPPFPPPPLTPCPTFYSLISPRLAPDRQSIIPCVLALT